MTITLEERVRSMTPSQRKALSVLATPRIVEPYFRHIPHPTQQLFLSLNGYREVLFGGAAGGGKSDALLMAALQYVDVPGYAALILRMTWPDLVLPGAIMDRANEWLLDTPAKKKDGGRVWVFPSGARIQFGHLQHDKDKYNYRSAEFQFIAFDELTQWAQEGTFAYLHSRLRRPALACLTCNKTLTRIREHGGTARYYHSKLHERKNCRKVYPDPKTLQQYPAAKDGTTVFDVPIRMRAATNPGGPGTDWVKKRFIDKRTKRDDNVFVPSLLKDNPSLNEEEYAQSLEYLDEVNKERLLRGDWDVQEAGDMFDRANFIYLERIPSNVTRWVRFWDMAASEDSGDFTVGSLIGVMDDNTIVVADVVRRQRRPHDVENVIRATAATDGVNVGIRIEQEPGSSGLVVIDHYRRNVLAGFDFDGVRATGSKSARASAFASYVRAKKVKVVIAPWNRDFLNELEQFPNGAHDDQVDSVAGGFNELMFGSRVRLLT